MWKTNITDTVGAELGEQWKAHEDKAAAHYGNAGSLKKNPLAVSRALESAWGKGLKSQALIDLVEDILDFERPKDINTESAEVETQE